MEHQCRWLKGHKCWQKGKRVKKAECMPCLFVNVASVTGWMHTDIKVKKSKRLLEES